ncbi:LysE family translocator [Arhodomonas sp. AD133]|uniref:LysE family translocator n=1 Tax=Arhodomonas sp. AD133 TaxID=3415009 RepID=UPI003EBEDE8A
MDYWLAFVFAAFLINISPGPDLIYILSRTTAHGMKVGIASSLGVATGALVHVLAAALGISAILMASATAFMLVKYAGAAYLIYLGIQALRSAGTRVAVPARGEAHRVGVFEAFRQGVLIDVLNPKVAVFFMAFLPQFVRADAGPVPMQLLLLGVAVIAVGIVVELTFVALVARVTRLVRDNPALARWLDRVLGSVMIALGARLALSRA